MMLGVVTYNIAKDWDIETIIEKLETHGYSAVELRTTHKHGVEPSLSAAERETVRDRFARSQVRLLSLGTTCEFHSPDPAVRRQNIEEAQRFIELAHDVGCWGIKVRPNGLPDGVPERVTIQNIAVALRECGDLGQRYGVEIWVEVHGRQTQDPARMRAIMDACGHPNVGVCWNCNPGEVKNGSIRESFDLLKDHIKNVHMNVIPDYPSKEFFALLKQSGYNRYMLAEVASSPEPDRFLKYYRALWQALQPGA